MALSKKQNRRQGAAASDLGGSLIRMLALLDLFTPDAPAWSAIALVQQMKTSRSTGYRYIRALSSAGLLAAGANGHYILGPRITELDRQIRQCDPLFNAAGPAMRSLAKDTGHSVLLNALFSDHVMCIRGELSDDSPPNLLARGERRPLFVGAASKIILPYLPAHQLKTLFTRHRKAIAKAKLGSDWSSFRTILATIRRDGYVVTEGEFNRGVIGLSAPLFNSTGRVIGSLGIAAAEQQFRRHKPQSFADRVMSAAQDVSDALKKRSTGLDRPPRAIGGMQADLLMR